MKDNNLIKLKEFIEGGHRSLQVTGISGTARVYFISRLLEELDRPVLIVTPSASEAIRFYRELEFFLPESFLEPSPDKRRLYDFPIYDISPLAGLSPHKDVVTGRLQALYTLTSHRSPIIVTSVAAVSLKILPKATLINSVDFLESQEEFEREPLIKKLEQNGYQRTSLVEERGDYTVRGGVIDIFPPLYSEPVRLEFWGDRLESIRHFDTITQRSTGYLKELTLIPANEIIMGNENIQRARSMGRMPTLLNEVGSFPGQEAWLNHFYGSIDSIFDYLPERALQILIDPPGMEREGNRFIEKFESDVEKYQEGEIARSRPFPEIEGIALSYEEIRDIIEARQNIDFSDLAIEKNLPGLESVNIDGTSTVDDDLDIKFAGKGRASMAPLAEKISLWVDEGARVVLVCRTEQQAGRLTEILGNYLVRVDEERENWEGISKGKGLSICLGRLSKGFSWPGMGLYLVSEDEIFGPKRARAKGKARAGGEGLSWTSLSTLKVEDLVVHEDHGIGRYGGLCKMEIEKKANDFVLIEYANNDRLYIPADRISVIQKYIGADEKNPKLDQLGGRSWDVAKKKAKKSIREIAKQLVELYALRKHRKGFAYSRPDNYFREFEATFEYEETPDQIKTIDDVISDMELELPMDRLVCGDVGFGKTEVAVRAAFKAVADGKQVAFLVPTTVLAEQHFETLRKRMEPYEINVGVLSRFKSKKEQKDIIAQVRSGKTNIIIGTHRILQKDISFKDLGLVIIDEEQRFGVNQKEALKKYRALVDVLSLTATPIPRTFHMSLMGLRDLSIIETPPEDRLAIQTNLSHFDEPTIKRAIESELERKGQVFFVHNRVQTIENMARRLKELVPKARFAVAHGQLRERKLEGTMLRFLKKEIDVLVCTTIIESGLDITSANTIIINEVDRFGLSQIYQLRGRVGRGQENAYAYLILSSGAKLTRDAEKRLRALMDFTQLGAGIHLALHDLKIRGAGNILGFSQSGHISAIGYELYLKMIEQNIAELKGEEWHEDINPEINISVPAYFPGDYVSDTDVRLNLYRRLSSLSEKSELESITDEIKDRFGPVPTEVSNLLDVVSVRFLLKKTGVIKLDITPVTLVFTFSEKTEMDPRRLIELVAKQPGKFQFLSERKLKVVVSEDSSLGSLQMATLLLKEFRGKNSIC